MLIFALGQLCQSRPLSHLYPLQVGYVDGVLEVLESAANVEAYIASIWTHLQTNYCHSTLGSKVLVERLAGIKHYSGVTLIGDGASLEKMFDDTEKDLGSADLMLYFGFDGLGYTQGQDDDTVVEFQNV